MTLRRKILLIMLLMHLLLMSLLYISSKIIVLGSFAKLEEQHTRKHVKRVHNALQDNIATLDMMVNDWAAWDDTYQFINDGNEAYISSNLVDETFVTSRLNVMLFLNRPGTLVFGKAFDLEHQQEVPIPQSLQEHLTSDSVLLTHEAPKSSVGGILLLPEAPLLLVSRPIVTSEDQGPIRGTLIMGRYLNEAAIQKLAEMTYHSITILRLDAPHLPLDFQQARLMLHQNGPIAVQHVKTSSIAGYMFIHDIYQNPILLLRVDTPRAIYKQGQTSVFSFLALLLIFSLLIGGGITLLLEKNLLSRLSQLSSEVSTIHTNHDLATHLEENGEDEIATLAHKLNQMLAELRQSQADIRENEERYRTLIETSPDAILVTDLSGYLVMVNQRAVELYGYEDGDALFDVEVFDLIVEKDRDQARDMLCAILETDSMRHVEYMMVKQDETTFLAELNVSVITDFDGNPRAIIHIVRDVTGRKHIETALRKSEERYRNLIENAPLGIISIDTQGRIIDVNSMMVAMLGSPSAEAMREMNILTLPSLIEAGIAGDFQHCLETGFPESSEHPYISDWGKDVYLRYHLTPIREADDGIVGVQAIVEDISEHKWAQEALQESEAEYSLLFKNMLSGFAYHKIVFNEENEPIDFLFLTVNEAYERLTGFGKEAIGKRASDVIPELSTLEPDLIETYGNVAVTGEQITFDLYFKPFEMWFAVSAYSPEPGYVVTVLDDITDRKLMETTLRKMNEQLEQRVEGRTLELQEANKALEDSLEQLRRTQERLVETEKMAALGGLVAGVAHEINTPVGVGVTAASHLDTETAAIQKRYETGQMKRSDLENYFKTAGDSSKMILSSLRRAAEQVQSFKQIAVDQVSDEQRQFNLKTYLDGVLFSLHPTLRKTRHHITFDCPEDIDLHSYPGAFSQILTNLVMNSLLHGFEDMEEGDIKLEVSHEEHTLSMRYTDNGKGMKEEIRGRIFEPFFTTKRSQGGSGLGLHIVYNLVTQRLHGQITCNSQPGQGTTFVIHIPLEA